MQRLAEIEWMERHHVELMAQAIAKALGGK
jgi:hypothetical protein